MSESFCTYEGQRDDVIVAYVYDDIEPAARAGFETHLARCSVCRDEVAALGVVRHQLARWSPPEPRVLARAAAGAQAERLAGKPPARPERSAWDLLGDIPAWAQVAAALLVLGVSAGIANIEVRYDANGLAVRTGWSERPAASAPAVSPAVASQAAPENARANGSAGAGAADVATGSPEWRADLAALEQALRAEIAASTTAQAAPGGDPVLRRVQALIAESERRQQSELALRVAEVVADVSAQRQADLYRIQRAIGAVEINAGVAVTRNQQLINNLALKAGQRQ